ncbi:MAG: DUF3212 family protein [Ruminobacter sp.]|nr:DUF3212 family protein [Ruminobacter sp.]
MERSHCAHCKAAAKYVSVVVTYYLSDVFRKSRQNAVSFVIKEPASAVFYLFVNIRVTHEYNRVIRKQFLIFTGNTASVPRITPLFYVKKGIFREKDDNTVFYIL